MTCPSCGSANGEGAKFCVGCGTPLARTCAACGTPATAGQRFCAECGAPVDGQVRRVPITAPALEPSLRAPVAERRLVSVLFADLVGFTAGAAVRDAEETRELLSRYFDASRRVIERYGGTVEKFIGDAVMAVWGTPVAQEDDAERCVRAALDLLSAVSDLAEELHRPDLRVRAGVLTGEAAVTLGATDQGMVAGDLVNTASRIQGAANPGEVLVGEVTRRATEAAVAYADAGHHELKGKPEPVPLFRALRVVGGRAGALKSPGLEAPFVGRDREFRLVKDLFHATGEEGRPRLVSLVGVAGIGKSRLAWEFFKYIDGLAEEIWWHRGRCLSYGDGVAYWALAEMVRMRAGIAEEEAAADASRKLREALERYVADPDERSWIEPRLAHLLALDEHAARDREDLFSAWRLFFERLAEHGPCVLVFEDVQWADSGLLDFVEYVLEWSRNHPFFVLTLGRPELLERRTNWGAGGRNSTSLYVEPLAEPAMDDLLCGLAPGLPDGLRMRIRERADGIPLYAVETVRMLLDRGLLERVGNAYRPTGPVDALEVPETLHALVAARIDGLPPDERQLLRDASVLGKTFTRTGLALLLGRPEQELDPLLASLVRKEILGLQADPRSPERGQYGFLQALMQRVAYETLSRAERKSLHVAAARYLELAWGSEDDEVVEVVAAHLVDAYRAQPEAEDASALRDEARLRIARAGERAASLGAWREATAYHARAAELTEDPLERARHFLRAGESSWRVGVGDEAIAYLERAREHADAASDARVGARASARLGEVIWQQGRIAEALALMERAHDVLADDETDESAATLTAELARLQFFAGEPERAAVLIERCLEVAEAQRFPELISQALNTKALILQRRPEEALGLLRHALRVALEHDLVAAAGRAYFNISYVAAGLDRFDEAREALESMLALARQRGYRLEEQMVLAQLTDILVATGDWNEALAIHAELQQGERVDSYLVAASEAPLGLVHLRRGDVDLAAAADANVGQLDTGDVQARSQAGALRAIAAAARGDLRTALDEGEGAVSAIRETGGVIPVEILSLAGEAALGLGELERVEALLAPVAALPPVLRTQSVRAHEARLLARRAIALGTAEGVEENSTTAAALFREVGTPFALAVALLEHGEWLGTRERAAEARPLLEEADEIFARLRAVPWLERLDAVRARSDGRMTVASG